MELLAYAAFGSVAGLALFVGLLILFTKIFIRD